MSQERLMKILLKAHISEKSTMVADKHKQFVFKVLKDANKQEVKAAVEKLFDVKVDKVRITNVKGKLKVTRNRKGRRDSWKKAYVCLAEGSDINFADAEAK